MKESADWENYTSYKKKSQELVEKIKVINDTAEYGVKLIPDYKDKLTRNQKQFLIQVFLNIENFTLMTKKVHQPCDCEFFNEDLVL